MTEKERFDECVKKAVELGRSWMPESSKDFRVTKEEWQLAVALFIDGYGK